MTRLLQPSAVQRRRIDRVLNSNTGDHVADIAADKLNLHCNDVVHALGLAATRAHATRLQFSPR